MLQLRPTFSESWYRVADLRPRLRAGAQLSRQFYRGERWYVVRDPAANQFHRLSDAAYRFIGLLDGRRTVAEAWDLVGGQLADDAPTQPEVIHILTQLYAANLLETDVTPDSAVLLRRHKQQVKRKMQNRAMNVLFPRIPLWDPDRFLCRWMPVARVLFSKLGAIIWLVVMLSALAFILPDWQRLGAAATHAFDFQHNAENIFWLYVTFIFIKLIHELGHAFACRRFGGECHELGLMLLVLVPTPYVDASTAWSFSNKWERVFVGAAGMIVELFFAALCAFVWALTAGGSSPLINQLAYNAMLIASVSTVIFNANPLLRYDGYYILSDLLEIPNLRQKSVEYTLGIIKRRIFRIKLSQPLPPLGQRIWLFSYAIASGIYRVFIGVMIVLLVTYKVPVLGVLMAIGGVATWAVVPLFQLGRYLLLDPELHRKRKRAISFSLSVAAAVIVLVGLIRFPVHVEFEGIVQPDDPIDSHGHVQSGELRAAEEGRVVEIDARDGQKVAAGQVILVQANPSIQRDIEVAQARIEEVEARIRRARVTDLTEFNQNQADLNVWQDNLHDAQERQAELTVRAPFAGTLVAPDLHEMMQTFLPRGQQIGEVAVLNRLVIRGDIEQKDYQLVREFPPRQASIKLAGLADQTLPGGKLTLAPAAGDILPHPALSQIAGGDIEVDPHDPNGTRTQTPEFEARILLDNSAGQFYAGQRATVRLKLNDRSLAWLWSTRFLQLINNQDTGRWL